MMAVVSIIVLVLINIIAWGILHFVLSYLCFIIPIKYFYKDRFIFRVSEWEQKSEVWDSWFQVRKWKDHIIDGSVIVKQSFDKRKLKGAHIETLKYFSAETKRAELTHLLLILPAPLFFLWNPVWAGWVNIVYALAFYMF
jgi:glycosyl-4,4'-diaponeurosporenoate acyltransferase